MLKEEVAILSILKEEVTFLPRQLERGGKLYYCFNCGLTQKIVSESLENELQAIYDTYETYKCNIEPLVFSSDATALRSNLILNEFRTTLRTIHSGIHVDVGCGDGAFLKEFNKCCPNSKLEATSSLGLGLEGATLPVQSKIPARPYGSGVPATWNAIGPGWVRWCNLVGTRQANMGPIV